MISSCFSSLFCMERDKVEKEGFYVHDVLSDKAKNVDLNKDEIKANVEDGNIEYQLILMNKRKAACLQKKALTRSSNGVGVSNTYSSVNSRKNKFLIEDIQYRAVEDNDPENVNERDGMEGIRNQF